MSQDQFGSENQGFPQEPMGIDGDIHVPHTGGRIRAIVGIVVVLVAAAIGLYWWMGAQKEMEKHKAVRTAFEAAHIKNYVEFWNKARINVVNCNNDADFERAALGPIRKAPVTYGKELKEQVAPFLEKGLADYKAIQAPPAYADKLKAVVDALASLAKTVQAVADELIMLDGFLEGQTKVKKMDTAWFNAQTWDDPQYHPNAFKYYKLLGCVLKDQKVAEMVPAEINVAVAKSCAEDKAAWFRRVAFDCYTQLYTDDSPPDQAFVDALVAIRAKAAGKVDETSRQALGDCIKEGREQFELDLARKLEPTWHGYDKARKEFLDANNLALGK